MIEIVPAQSGDPLEHLIALSGEYITWLMAEVREHYPDLDIDEFTTQHVYDDIRKKFPGEHVPPHGCLLVALLDGVPCGCVAVGKLDDAVCEVRTLFVRPIARGAGAAKKLVEASLHEARTLGYRYARLDTMRFMEGAYTLYRSFGFYDIAPYREVSHSLAPHIRFLECDLTGARKAT